MLYTNFRESYARLKKTVVSIQFAKNRRIIAQGSGFVVRERMFTNYHVFNGPECDRVRILRNFGNNGEAYYIADFSYDEWKSMIVTCSFENEKDYAVVDATKFGFDTPDIIEIEMCKDAVQPGDIVLFGGYPFNMDDAVMHMGMISRKYIRNGAIVYQIDGSINVANSGGPLINAKTGRICGIVTRRETGLLEDLKKISKDLELVGTALAQSRGPMLNDVNVLEVLGMALLGMAHTSKEIFRSANVGIGYAFSIENLVSDFIFEE